jgi:hypothetical protein
MTRYKIELNTGLIINVPNDKAHHEYEHIGTYGMGAVLERAYRTRAYKKAKANNPDIGVRAIICPNGERVTNF